MIRDFTKGSIDTFRRELNKYKEEKDLFGLRYKFPDYDILCELDIVPYIDEVKKYGNNITIKCKTADNDMDKILKQVETIDANYAARLDAIHGRMKAFQRQIKNFSNIMTPEAIDLGENYYGDYLTTFQAVYQSEVKKSEKELKRLKDLSAVYDTKWYNNVVSGASGFLTALIRDNLDNMFLMSSILNNFIRNGKFSAEGSENAKKFLDYLERKYLNDKYANKTWYYGGRNLGNLTNMVSGAYSFVQGINTMALGVGGSSASMALTSTGAGSAIGIPVGVVSGATVAAGAAVTTFGGALTYSSASNFKNNWEKFKESKSRGGNKGSNNSAKGLIGHDFEDYLTNNVGGGGSFSVGGRDFDGGIGNRWWEAKSGQYWDMLENNPSKLVKFKSDMGDRLRIANQNGASYEIFSNTPIPDSIKTWLTKKGIPFTEILD